MKNRLIIGAAGLTIVGVLATAGSASAHSADVRAECHKGKPMAAVHLSNYNGTNTVSLTNDGSELTPGSFGSSYDAQFDLGDPTVSHLVVYSIVANDDPDNAAGFSPHGTLTVPACQAPPTTEAPPVTEAPTTTTAAPAQVIRLVRASCLAGVGAGLRVSIYNPVDVSYTVAYDGVVDPAHSVTVPASTLDQRVIRWDDPLSVHTYSVVFSDGVVRSGTFPGPCPVTTPAPTTSTTIPPVAAVDAPPTVPPTDVTVVVPAAPVVAVGTPPIPAPVAPTAAPIVAPPAMTELPSTGSTSLAIVGCAGLFTLAGIAILMARRPSRG